MWRALAQHVIACASLILHDDGSVFEYAVYIDAVPGHDHNQEYIPVSKVGDKVGKKIAEAIFPELKGNKYRW